MRAALAALVVAAFAAVVPSAAHAQSGQGFEPGEIQAGRALLAHVPADLRTSCVIDEVFHKVPVPGDVLTRVDCSPPDGLGADALTYYQFASTEAMNADYQSDIGRPVGTAPAGCLPDAPYSVDGQEVGRSACVPNGIGVDLEYTYAPLRVVGIISQFEDDAGNLDLSALYDFSDHRAGPDATAGKIPSLLTGAQQRQGAAALLNHLPAALRAKCTAQSVDSTPWVSASLECAKPSPGVDSMHLASYRTKDAFTFDPQAVVDRSEASNATCPDSGTWSSGGHVRGRFACTYDTAGNTNLTWTLDRARIIAYASANADRMTSKQLLAWWDQQAGLVP